MGVNPLQPLQPVVPVAPLLAVRMGTFLDAPAPPIDWLVPSLIPRGVPAMLVSTQGVGKTWLSLQMIIAISTGKSFLGYPASAPMGGIFLSLEDSSDVIHRRVRSIIDAFRMAGEWTEEDDRNFRKNSLLLVPDWEADAVDTGDDRIALAPTTHLPRLMPTLMDGIRAMEAEGVPPGLLVIDTFAAASEGDENSAKDMKPIMAAAYRIAGVTGYTPLMNHHTAKGMSGARNQSKLTIDEMMSMDWVRGSSAILGAVRFCAQMAVLRPDQAEKAKLDPDKARRNGYMVFGMSKQSGAPMTDWLMLERVDPGEPGAGSLALMPHSMEVLASLKGAAAEKALTLQDSLLAEIWDATRSGAAFDRIKVAKMFYPDEKKPASKLRGLMGKLRMAGLLQKDHDVLTAKGVTRAQELRGGVTDLEDEE